MTELLKRLLHDYGLLYISIVTMEKARKQWSNTLGPIMSDEELAELPIEKDEPVVVVRKGKGEEPDFLGPGEHGIQFTDKETKEPVGHVSVLELPEDEFYFFGAFRGGLVGLASELPDFFFGMCLVHAHGLFEHHVRELLKSIFLSRPEMLGTSKTVKYGDVLESYPSMAALLEGMVENELRELFYKSWRDLLEVLREKYGFKQLPTTLDERTIEFSLIRNCFVHNHGIADARIEKHSKGTYKCGTSISIDGETVLAAIKLFRTVATVIDSIAETQHFKDQSL